MHKINRFGFFKLCIVKCFNPYVRFYIFVYGFNAVLHFRFVKEGAHIGKWVDLVGLVNGGCKVLSVCIYITSYSLCMRIERLKRGEYLVDVHSGMSIAW